VVPADTHPEFDGTDFRRSARVPYHPGEPPLGRHRRRLREALAGLGDVARWCEARGVVFTAKADGKNLWDFYRPYAHARWVPSRARFSCCPDWRASPRHRRVKVYDWGQLLWALDRLWLAELEG
jgi:hypothetical protein